MIVTTTSGSGQAAWPIVLSAFGGALVAIVGIIVGKFLDTISESRQWRRNKSAQACADFIAAAEQTFAEIGRGRPDKIVCFRAFSSMTQAGAIVDVFGEAKVARLSRNVWNRFSQWLVDDRWDALENIDDKEWKTQSEACRRQVDSLINEVRATLKEKQIPKEPSSTNS